MSIRTKRKRSDTEVKVENTSAISEAEPPKEKRRKWRPRRNKTKKAKSGAEGNAEIVSAVDDASSWSVSRISSGKFLPKAIFSKDEKSVYVATERFIKQYNVRTGQCVRSFSGRTEKSKIVDFALDPLEDTRIIVAYDTSNPRVLNLEDGAFIKKIKGPHVPKKLVALDKRGLLQLASQSLFTITQRKESKKRKGQSLSVLDLPSESDPLVAADSAASIVCVASNTHVSIAIDGLNGSNFAELQFAWKIMAIKKEATSTACYKDTIAIGHESGSITLYLNINKYVENDSQPTETVLNWHVSPVTTLQFSSSGVYLMSGAAENTVMMTQISSGQRHFIPRLGASITGLNISSTGSLYAISLANNNIKIVDAGDLELISEFAGLQPIKRPSKKDESYRPPVTLLHPTREQLFINGSNEASGTLQGYDIFQDQQTVRLDVASLTRLKSTGTDLKPVSDPFLSHAAFTSDGKWLATIDEWNDRYALDDLSNMEVSLKFWDCSGKDWNVNTKIEYPHGITSRVLALASPKTSQLEFATLGAEGTVKTWRLSVTPKERIWTLYRTIGSRVSTLTSEGGLTYSTDGSIIAAGFGGHIYIINAQSGETVTSLHVSSSISKIENLGRYFLYVYDDSSLYSVWDVATGEILFTERLDRAYSSVAVNHSSSTFAIASPSSKRGKTSIEISRIVEGKKVEEARINVDAFVASVLGVELPEFSGFIYVDDAGQIGFVSHEQAVVEPTVEPAVDLSVGLMPKRVKKLTDEGKRDVSVYVPGATTGKLRKVLEDNTSTNIVELFQNIFQSLY